MSTNIARFIYSCTSAVKHYNLYKHQTANKTNRKNLFCRQEGSLGLHTPSWYGGEGNQYLWGNLGVKKNLVNVLFYIQ